MNEGVTRQSLAGTVFEHLCMRLARRDIKIGDRINAREIAVELSVSRTTVNKAIEQLTEAGWVKPGHGRHPMVVAVPPEQQVDRPITFEFANQTDSVYELLLDRIVQGELTPGCIVKERPLAVEFEVNPATVRRAAEWLRNDGLLERLPRRGWQVTLLSSQDLTDAYRIRLLLEPFSLASTVKRISDGQLDALEEDATKMIQLGERATVFERRNSDYEFHKQLCEASGNRVLTEAIEPVIRKVLLITTVGFRYSRAERSFEEHRDIIRALKTRSEKTATNLCKQHLRNALKFNAAIWERGPGTSP